MDKEFKFGYGDPKTLDYNQVDFHGRHMVKYINERIPWMDTTMYCSGHPIDGDMADYNSGWFSLGWSNKTKIGEEIQRFSNHIDFIQKGSTELFSETIPLDIAIAEMYCFGNHLYELMKVIRETNGKSQFHLDLVIWDMDKYLEFINTFRKDPRVRDIVLRHGTRWDFGTPYKYEEWDIAEILIWYQSAYEREAIISAVYDNLTI